MINHRVPCAGEFCPPASVIVSSCAGRRIFYVPGRRGPFRGPAVSAARYNFRVRLFYGVDMSLVFAWEKLYLAVDALCGRGSQADRLVDATTLCLSNIRPDDLPVELRGAFIQLMEELTAVRADSDEASIRATINSLDASDRDKAIGKILHIFSAICRHFEV